MTQLESPEKMTEIVRLEMGEILVATYIGSMRNAESKIKGRRPRFKERHTGELWGYHIESAHAELVVAKYLGVYWGFKVNTFHVPDIENTNYEVRFSNRSDVKIRPDDSGIIISVSGECPEYRINGWVKADEGKQEIYKCHKEPICYFYPHSKLNDIRQLKK